MDFSNKANILILFANAYNMLDEQKRPLSGCTVHYLFWGEDGERLLAQSEWNPANPVGVQRAKCSIDESLRVKIPIAPALYEGTFIMTVGGDGKPVMKLQDVAFISNVEIKAKQVPGLVVPGMVVPEAAAVDASKPDSKTANK